MSKDEQAIDWFVSHYPGRFSDPKYLHDERTYKWDAHLLFVELLGDAQLDKLLGAGEISTIVERIPQDRPGRSPQEDAVTIRDDGVERRAQGCCRCNPLR